MASLISSELLHAAKTHVAKLLEERLGPHFYFHNIRHTHNVAVASQEIGLQSGLDQQELDSVLLASYFHDTGYIVAYKDHELASAEFARDFLERLGLAEAVITQVVDCILATRFPQQPSSLLEMVICDADFYHFSVADYLAYAEALQREWAENIGLRFTANQWNSINLEMLQSHHYFTAYGKTMLQPQKEKNIHLLQQLI